MAEPEARVAILADIHGNLQALEAVLEDVVRHGVERVVVNGDLVNRGPNNPAVMVRLAETGFAMTLGNHDDLMCKWVDGDPDLPGYFFDDPFWEGTAWCARQLRREGWIETLRRMPMTQRLDLPGAPSVLISHGSPRHYREGYGRFLTDEAISEITQMHPADVLVGSHTHRPMERTWGHYLVLNTGAVGTPFNGDTRAQYLILTLQHGRWRPTFRCVDYDREGALRAFEELGYPGRGRPERPHLPRGAALRQVVAGAVPDVVRRVGEAAQLGDVAGIQGQLSGPVPRRRTCGLKLDMVEGDQEPALRLYAATEADRDLLFEIHRFAFRELVGRVFGAWDDSWQRSHFDEHYVPERNRIVRLGARAIGRLVVRVERREVVLENIAIIPEFQGRGFGTRLLERIITEAHRLDRAVSLEVFETNPAQRLYRRLGFQVTEQREGRLTMRLGPNPEADSEP